jgi:hypothetical protein
MMIFNGAKKGTKTILATFLSGGHVAYETATFFFPCLYVRWSVTPHKDASPASHGRNTPVIIGDTFHVRRWPFCFKSNVNDRWLHHDRCGHQFDCNERFRELRFTVGLLIASDNASYSQTCPTTSSSLEIL